MIILVGNGLSIDKVTNIKSNGGLDYYGIMEFTYGGKLLLEKDTLVSLVASHMDSLNALDIRGVVLFNNMSTIFDDKPYMDTKEMYILNSLRRLHELGHRIVAVNFKDLNSIEKIRNNEFIEYGAGLSVVIEDILKNGVKEIDTFDDPLMHLNIDDLKYE